MIASIRAGKPLNEGQRIAESTLTAIGARMSATTGRSFKFDWLLAKAEQFSIVPSQDKLKKGPGIFYPISTGADPLV